MSASSAASAPGKEVSKERRKERKEEEEDDDGDNGFPSFSDLPISASTTHYDVSQRKIFSCACMLFLFLAFFTVICTTV